jgi:hypothetical protein
MDFHVIVIVSWLGDCEAYAVNHRCGIQLGGQEPGQKVAGGG